MSAKQVNEVAISRYQRNVKNLSVDELGDLEAALNEPPAEQEDESW